MAAAVDTSTHARVCAAVRPEVLHADDGVAYAAAPLRCGCLREALSEQLCLAALPLGRYFQTSGFALKLRPAVEEAIRWMRFQCQGPALPHVSAEMAYDGKQVQRARAAVARTINAAPEEVMLNECCAVGVNYVACGIDWREGDVVVLTEHEHPSNRIPWCLKPPPVHRHGR